MFNEFSRFSFAICICFWFHIVNLTHCACRGRRLLVEFPQLNKIDKRRLVVEFETNETKIGRTKPCPISCRRRRWSWKGASVEMKLTCSNYVEFNSVCELIATQLKQFRKLAGGGGGIIFAWPTEKRPMKMGFIIINLKGQPTRMLKSYPTDLEKFANPPLEIERRRRRKLVNFPWQWTKFENIIIIIMHSYKTRISLERGVVE